MMRLRPAVKLLPFLLVTLPLLAACATLSVSPSDTAPTVTNTYPALTFTAAVEKVAAEGTWVAITSFTDGRMISLDAGRQDFKALVARLEAAELTGSLPRYRVLDGRTFEATVPYSIAFTLDFALSDGSVLAFDYGGGQLWFNARNTIYTASTGLGLYDLLTGLYAQQD